MTTWENMKTQGKVWLFYDAERKKQTKPLSVVQAQVVLLSLRNKDLSKYFVWTPGFSEWVSVQDFLESDQKYFAQAQPPRPAAPVPAQETDPDYDPDRTVTHIESTPLTSGGDDSPYTEVVVGDTPLKASDYGYYFEDFNGADLDLSKIRKIKPDSTKKKAQPAPKPAEASSSDRRRDTRHNLKIEVVLVSKTRSFRTYSKNISLSGTLLEDEIPKEYLNRPFDLIIVNPFEPDPRKARLLFRAKIVGDMEDPRRLMFIEQDVHMTLRLDALLKAYVTYQVGLKKSAG
ncbi:hypothetical protein D3C87_109960 [compost metagenome]